jgi:hypothetical protein
MLHSLACQLCRFFWNCLGATPAQRTIHSERSGDKDSRWSQDGPKMATTGSTHTQHIVPPQATPKDFDVLDANSKAAYIEADPTQALLESSCPESWLCQWLCAHHITSPTWQFAQHQQGNSCAGHQMTSHDMT